MIAKITSGGSFGGVLDYLMNPKKDEQERKQEREQGPDQGQSSEVERTAPAETKGHEEATPGGAKKTRRPEGQRVAGKTASD